MLRGILKTQQFNIGDYVSVLNEPIYGTVISVGQKKTKITDTDGFEREYLNERLVLAKPVEQYKLHDAPVQKESQIKINRTLKVTESKEKMFQSFEIDLHFDTLSEKYYLEENYQILQKQLSACRAFCQKAIRNKTKRIVIIHGKGEGVLKSEVYLYLNRLKNDQGIRLEFHDAPYNEYGIGGATEVIFY